MKAQTETPFVDTTIIPDRNAGIGSLLLDLLYPQDPDKDRPPLLGPEFAFIDVGASCARVSTALKTLLAKDLRMNVEYVATELPEVVPYALVTPSGNTAEKMYRHLSLMISTSETKREVMDWHYVIDRNGKVSSIAYSYNHFGNEVWESYFMSHAFMISGEKVEFRNPALDEIIAPDIKKIEEKIDQERKYNGHPGLTGPLWEGYRIEKNPLEAGLAEFGISLQKTAVPQRIMDRQNVLYLGNVLNHYPKEEQASELDRISTYMQEGDIVIVQSDEMETASIEVLKVIGQGTRKKRERVRWINSGKLEVRKPVPGTGSWQQINLKPGLEQIVSLLTDCLGRKLSSPEWNQVDHKLLVRQFIYQIFGTFFRALPVEETIRIAIREALRRLPSGGALKGIPVFRDDAKDAYGGGLGSDPDPIVSEADLIMMKTASANVVLTLTDNTKPRNAQTTK
jgi:hypothetical protein